MCVSMDWSPIFGVFQPHAQFSQDRLRSTIMLTRIKGLLKRNERMFTKNLLCLVFYKHSSMLCTTDNPDGICIARRDSTCSFYQPPPPSDIEKMRNNMIKEQKVFALIREILSKKYLLVMPWLTGKQPQLSVRQLFPFQFTWGSSGCCSWWLMVSEIPMLTTSLSTFNRVSGTALLTV